MNEELQKQLAGYLESIASAAKAGGSLVLEQAPLVVQEKIAYGRAYETVWLGVFALAIAGGVYVMARRGQWFHGPSYSETPGLKMLGLLCSVWGTAGALFNLGTVLQVWFAPRLYILEWVASMVAGK